MRFGIVFFIVEFILNPEVVHNSVKLDPVNMQTYYVNGGSIHECDLLNVTALPLKLIEVLERFCYAENAIC